MAVLDTEKPSDLSEQECKALIEVLELRNRLSDMQQEAKMLLCTSTKVSNLKLSSTPFTSDIY